MMKKKTLTIERLLFIYNFQNLYARFFPLFICPENILKNEKNAKIKSIEIIRRLKSEDNAGSSKFKYLLIVVSCYVTDKADYLLFKKSESRNKINRMI